MVNTRYLLYYILVRDCSDENRQEERLNDEYLPNLALLQTD